MNVDISPFAELTRRTGGTLHPIKGVLLSPVLRFIDKLSGSLLSESTVFLLQQELNFLISSHAGTQLVYYLILMMALNCVVLGSEAILKLRCSNGFKSEEYIGPGNVSVTFS